MAHYLSRNSPIDYRPAPYHPGVILKTFSRDHVSVMQREDRAKLESKMIPKMSEEKSSQTSLGRKTCIHPLCRCSWIWASYKLYPFNIKQGRWWVGLWRRNGTKIRRDAQEDGINTHSQNHDDKKQTWWTYTAVLAHVRLFEKKYSARCTRWASLLCYLLPVSKMEGGTWHVFKEKKSRNGSIILLFLLSRCDIG